MVQVRKTAMKQGKKRDEWSALASGHDEVLLALGPERRDRAVKEDHAQDRCDSPCA
jgi:hypothetical protein